MNPGQSFLGQGWSFPPGFTNGGRQLELVAGPEDIVQSLEILLGTQLGERMMQEDFGADMNQFLFHSVDSGLLNKMRGIIADAIVYHEIRIHLNDVGFITDKLDEGYLIIRLDYTIPASNSRYNMVYPFYLKEN